MLNFVRGKGIKNCVKTRGGTLFCNALKKSLHVNEMVRRRALKERVCKEPVKCGSTNGKIFKNTNKQDTVGNCNGSEPANFCHKVRRYFGLDRPPALDTLPAVPLSFFCLPNFDLQTEEINEPHQYEDLCEFLFVDPKKFLARNSTSVLFNTIFHKNSSL